MGRWILITLGGANVITGLLINGRERQKRKNQRYGNGKELADVPGFDGRAKE